MTDPFRVSPPTRVGMTRLQRQLAVDHNEESKECRNGRRSTKHHPEQRRRDARRSASASSRHPPEETRSAVAAALDTGYRHIDTAAAYGNEREVGEAVHALRGGRAAVFIETKIWISDYGYDETLHAFDKSAGKLGVDQIDLLILHQALPSDFDKTLDAYRALETLLERRQGPRDRRQQLHGRPPHQAARHGRRRPGGQPDRAAPLLPAAARCRRSTPSTAS